MSLTSGSDCTIQVPAWRSRSRDSPNRTKKVSNKVRRFIALIRTVQEFLDHKDVKATMIYLDVLNHEQVVFKVAAMDFEVFAEIYYSDPYKSLL